MGMSPLSLYYIINREYIQYWPHPLTNTTCMCRALLSLQCSTCDAQPLVQIGPVVVGNRRTAQPLGHLYTTDPEEQNGRSHLHAPLTHQCVVRRGCTLEVQHGRAGTHIQLHHGQPFALL